MQQREYPLLESLGGAPGCHRLSAAFYGRVARDPILRPFFPGKSFKCAIEAFSAFLVQFLGGPDRRSRWAPTLRESHLRFAIEARHRDAWLTAMELTFEDAAVPEPARSALRALFDRASAHLVNRGTQPESHAVLTPDVEARWKGNLCLEQAVTAIRSGDTAPALALLDSGDSAPGLLILMLRYGHSGPVRQFLAAHPSLVHERIGRDLFHTAAAVGDLETVKLFLHIGADPNMPDGGGHPPLYSVANECQAPGSAAVIRALVAAGADVNAAPGAMRCTALHMAARRGNIEAAEALLACGANPQARDRRGDTPPSPRPQLPPIRGCWPLATEVAEVSPIAGPPYTDFS